MVGCAAERMFPVDVMGGAMCGVMGVPSGTSRGVVRDKPVDSADVMAYAPMMGGVAVRMVGGDAVMACRVVGVPMVCGVPAEMMAGAVKSSFRVAVCPVGGVSMPAGVTVT